MDPLVLWILGPLLIKSIHGNAEKIQIRKDYAGRHSPYLQLISFCINDSPATSNVGDSSVFLSSRLVLWRCCVSVSHLCLTSFVLVSSKWDKAQRKRWMRAKKSNYSSTSMMERKAEGTAGISASLTHTTTPCKGNWAFSGDNLDVCRACPGEIPHSQRLLAHLSWSDCIKYGRRKLPAVKLENASTVITGMTVMMQRKLP